ncbi:MAG: hypothetical protein RL177_681 [Bacteroidota bacterium]
MKHVFVAVVLISFVFASSAHAQGDAAAAAKSAVGGNLGMTFVDGEAFYLINFNPELALGKVGLGLDVNLRFTTDGQVDTQDLTASKILRYVRYGSKGDSFYGRVGLLDYARLGNGFVLGNYKNTASYELRRVGLELDLGMENLGLETVLSDVGAPSVLGMRAHVRPLKFTPMGAIPIVGNLVAGATYATDLHPNANLSSDAGPGTLLTEDAIDGGRMSIIGLDLGLPIFSASWIKSGLYFDYAQIVDFGSGAAAGLGFQFKPLGLMDLNIQFERRYLGDQFLPRYFGAQYEQTRFTPRTDSTAITQAQELRYAKAVQGNYGEVTLNILGGLTINGQYYSPLGVKNAGEFFARVTPGFEIPGGFQFDAGMDRRRIGKIFVLDENTNLYANFGYKMNRFTLVSMMYQYTYAPVKNADGQTIRYKQQVRVEPRIGIIAKF